MLKSTNSCGYDDIQTNVLKACANEIAPVLTYLVNISFTTGVFPDKLKVSKIKPVYKKGNRDDMDNYRPISLIPVISKIFERAMHVRLTQFLTKFEIIKPQQNGFQKGKSTSLAAFHLVNKILTSTDKRVPVSAVDFNESPRNFSLELFYHTVQQTGEHVVISPFGIWTLLTAVALGATGNSYKQLSTALVLPENEASLINGYKKLTDNVLNPNTGDVQLTSKNFVFLDQSFYMLPDFNKTIQGDFKAVAKVLDFNDPKSADVANSYIEKTSGRVTNVLTPDDFTKARLILTNVVHFNGLWSSPFYASNTVKESFYDEKGTVNMMYQTGIFSFITIKQLQSVILELPYGKDRKYSMILILPDQNIKVSEVNRKLVNFGVEQVLKTVQNGWVLNVRVKIRRFHITSSVEMEKPLKNMGVSDIFEPGLAEFARLTREDVHVSAIVHKADIEVTEAGTDASAVTVVQVVSVSSSLPFYANRPFIYWVVEKSTSTVLFGGIYSNPTEF